MQTEQQARGRLQTLTELQQLVLRAFVVALGLSCSAEQEQQCTGVMLSQTHELCVAGGHQQGAADDEGVPPGQRCAGAYIHSCPDTWFTASEPLHAGHGSRKRALSCLPLAVALSWRGNTLLSGRITDSLTAVCLTAVSCVCNIRLNLSTLTVQTDCRCISYPDTGSQGRPVLIVLAARHDMSLRNLAETEQLIIYTLDNTAAAADAARNPLCQFLCLFDLSGAAAQCSPRRATWPQYLAHCGPLQAG